MAVDRLRNTQELTAHSPQVLPATEVTFEEGARVVAVLAKFGATKYGRGLERQRRWHIWEVSFGDGDMDRAVMAGSIERRNDAIVQMPSCRCHG